MSLAAATKAVRAYATTQLAIEPHYHGSFLAVDPSLRGYTRFGKCLGTDEVTVSSAVLMALYEDATTGSYTLTTRTKAPGTITGSLFKLPDTSLIRLYNPQQCVSNNGTYWSWTVDPETPLRTTYEAGSAIELYGHPCEVTLSVNSSVQVKSTEQIIPGDRLIPVVESGSGLIEGRPVEILSTGERAIIPGKVPLNSYPVVVSSALRRTLVDATVYLKADVGYISRMIPATEINGLFLIDCVSGTTLGESAEDIKLSVNIHRADYSIARSYPDVTKNTAVVLGATPAADLATGSVDRGRLVPMHDGTLYTVTDVDGLCGFGYDLIGPVETGLKLSITGVAGTTLKVETSEGSTVYEISTTGTVVDLSKVETDRVIFRLRGPANTTAHWKSLAIDEDSSFVSYSVVGRIKQGEQWSGSGLILKPVFSPIKDSYAVINGTTFIINGGAFL